MLHLEFGFQSNFHVFLITLSLIRASTLRPDYDNHNDNFLLLLSKIPHFPHRPMVKNQMAACSATMFSYLLCAVNGTDYTLCSLTDCHAQAHA